jgi:hypothetical protein
LAHRREFQERFHPDANGSMLPVYGTMNSRPSWRGRRTRDRYFDKLLDMRRLLRTYEVIDAGAECGDAGGIRAEPEALLPLLDELIRRAHQPRHQDRLQHRCAGFCCRSMVILDGMSMIHWARGEISVQGLCSGVSRVTNP